ncbi:hypothetical protein OG900_33175 [Streptomyces sp. NBC_00433]
MNPLKTIAAVRELRAADRALEALDDECDQTPGWYAANRRVDQADRNPYLPQSMRDPRDR